MRIVVALGGNALLRRGQPMELEVQRANAKAAAKAVAELASEHQLVVTHGNGPQVGLLAEQAETYRKVQPYPLDVLDAESQGMIGYLLEVGLENELPGQRVATLLTRTVVDADDPAFRHPTKPIGPVYPEDVARRLAAERGWTVAPDDSGYRRVVPSPEPRDIVEFRTIRRLVDAGVLAVCVGGGGIPVVAGEAKAIRGVEAVIDNTGTRPPGRRENLAHGLVPVNVRTHRHHPTPSVTARSMTFREWLVRWVDRRLGSARPCARSGQRGVARGHR